MRWDKNFEREIVRPRLPPTFFSPRRCARISTYHATVSNDNTRVELDMKIIFNSHRYMHNTLCCPSTLDAFLSFSLGVPSPLIIACAFSLCVVKGGLSDGKQNDEIFKFWLSLWLSGNIIFVTRTHATIQNAVELVVLLLRAFFKCLDLMSFDFEIFWLWLWIMSRVVIISGYLCDDLIFVFSMPYIH